MIISLSHSQRILFSEIIAARKEATKISDAAALIKQLDDATASVRNRLQIASVEYEEHSAVVVKQRTDKKAELNKAEEAIQGYWGLSSFEREPNHRDFNPVKVSSFDEVFRLRDEYQALPSNVDKTAVKELQLDLDSKTRQLKASLHAIIQSIERIDRLNRTAPEHILRLDNAMLEELVAIDLEELNIPPEPEHETWAEIAAKLRGELPLACGCDAGYVSVTKRVIDTDLLLQLNDEVRHPFCESVSKFKVEWLKGAIPTKHAAHRLASLRVWDKSPVPAEHQERVMSMIPETPEGLHGWLMLGPPGTSKTTYAAAAITDWLTFRMAENPEVVEDPWDSRTPGERLNYWRVKAPKWIREMEAYETRDFENDLVVEPFVTACKIEKATAWSGWTPILWLEELDKFHPTKNRLRNVYCLIDAVYEAGGIIVATANERAEELEKLLGEAIYRRVSGTNDSPEDNVVIDFYKLAEKMKRLEGKRK